MSCCIGFVIPVLNEEEHVAGLLRSLREQFPECELTVVDGGSDDHTVVNALPLCTRLLIGEPGRALQMNLGGQACTADYLFFLHADSMPSVSAEQLQNYLQLAPIWGFCRVRLNSPRRVFRVIEWFINLRSGFTAVGTGDQMLFMQRSEFERGGGFDAIPLMEDIACSKRLRRLAPPLVLTEPVVTSARRWEQRGILRTVLAMWALRLAYFVGVSPARLWYHYYGR